MEYTDELILIKQTNTLDNMGQPVTIETRRTILAKPNVVGTKEFYNALAVGIRPTAELRIRACNYDNEEEVEYRGNRYAVIRTLPKSKIDLILVIGIKQGVNS